MISLRVRPRVRTRNACVKRIRSGPAIADRACWRQRVWAPSRATLLDRVNPTGSWAKTTPAAAG
jgi:hypothetical protein